MTEGAARETLRHRVYRQMFLRAHGGTTLSNFNRFMIVVIIAAVALAIFGTEPTVVRGNLRLFIALEMAFGVIFLLEYLGRVWSVVEEPHEGANLAKRLRYMRSPLAIIDLVVVLASLSPFMFTDAAILRVVRLLRLAALAKFGRFNHALEELGEAVHSRRYELSVTVALAGCLILVGATALYWAEHNVQPEAFGSIPRAMWWAVITLTTVGYGDVSPITPLGKMFAAVIAVGGVALVAMPAGIMASAFSEAIHHRRERELADRLAQHVEDRVEEEIDRLVEEGDRQRR
jgi:voltage-gated potassium channel